MHIIGLTGGVACGKSKATSILRENNIPVIDCDAIVHDIQQNHPILSSKLKKLFPDAFENDKLNRKILSNIVYGKESLISQITILTKQFLLPEIDNKIIEYKNNKENIIAIDAPLLFESGLYKKCDCTVCIYIDEATQKNRFLQRPGMNEHKWQSITSTQMPLEEKKQRATYKILSDNESNLKTQLKEVVNDIKTENTINFNKMLTLSNNNR